MFCNACGSNVPDGSVTCPSCGNVLQATTANTAATMNNSYMQPMQQPMMNGQQYQFQQTMSSDCPTPGSIMAKGIVSAALSFTPVACIASIILGILAIKSASKFNQMSPEPSGQAKAGKITGIVGCVIGGIMCVVWLIYMISCITAVNRYGSYVRYYY